MKNFITTCFLALFSFYSLTQAQIFSSVQVLIDEIETQALNNALVPGDINQDGFTDFAGTKGFYLNQGDNTFSFQTLDANEKVIAIIDTDNDGDMDILKERYVMVNDGNNEFTSVYIPPFGTPSAFVQVADFNKDSLPDILGVKLQTFGDDDLILYLNLGDNTFEATVIDAEFDNGYVNIGDYDNDGWMDIVSAISNFSTDQILLYRNEEGMSFTRSDIAMGSDFDDRFIYFGDMDGDEDLDIVYSGNWGTIHWIKNNNGSFSGITPISDITGTWLDIADINEDGHNDICAINTDVEPYEVGYFLNNGMGNFGGFQVLTTISAFSQLSYSLPNTISGSIAIGNLTDDAVPDLIVNALVDGQVLWFENLTQPNSTEEVRTTSRLDNLKVYPTPTSGAIFIEKLEDLTMQFRVEVANVQGQKMYETQNSSFDIGHLDAGIYFLKISTEAAMVVRKIVLK